jgi:hypothetical protein
MARSPKKFDLSPEPDRETIAQRAYERFEARGREDGRDLDDWLEAERELNGMSAGTTAGERNDDNSNQAA